MWKWRAHVCLRGHSEWWNAKVYYYREYERRAGTKSDKLVRLSVLWVCNANLNQGVEDHLGKLKVYGLEDTFDAGARKGTMCVIGQNDKRSRKYLFCFVRNTLLILGDSGWQDKNLEAERHLCHSVGTLQQVTSAVKRIAMLSYWLELAIVFKSACWSTRKALFQWYCCCCCGLVKFLWL